MIGLKNRNEDILGSLKANRFNIESRIQEFIKILEVIESDFNISVEGSWGSGKTFFVKQLCHVINNKIELEKYSGNSEMSIEAIYFNANEFDFVDSPILALIYCLVKDDKFLRIEVKRRNSIIEDFAKLLKVFSLGNIDLSDLSNSDSIIKSIVEQEEVYIIAERVIDSILEETANRLIIFIDELDRCDPRFSLKTFESLKRLFSNKKVNFIFSFDRTQMNNTISHLYGTGAGTKKYLQKFVDYTINLEVVDADRYTQFLTTSIELSCNLNFEYLKLLNTYFKPNYRDLNRIITKFELMKFDSGSYRFKLDNYVYVTLIPFFTYVKCINPKSFSDIVNGNYNIVHTFMEDSKWDNWELRNFNYRFKEDDRDMDTKEIRTEVLNGLFSNKSLQKENNLDMFELDRAKKIFAKYIHSC